MPYAFGRVAHHRFGQANLADNMKPSDKEADLLPTPCQILGAAAPWSFRDILLANAARTGTLLDVGCGNGRELTGLAPFFDCIIAIDPDKTVLASARETFRRQAIRNIKVCAGRWQALPLRDASVDAVSSMFSGVHAAEAFRVLKPGGLLLVECVGPPEPGPAHVAHRDPQSATMEFAATLYAALSHKFNKVSIRHAWWPTEADSAELTGDAFVFWDAPGESRSSATEVPAMTLPRMRFIAVCRKT